MATDKHTWRARDVAYLYRILKLNTKGKRFMFTLFYDILEHESVDAKEKAKESIKHFPRLKKSIMKFGKAFEEARDDLIMATNNSDKY